MKASRDRGLHTTQIVYRAELYETDPLLASFIARVEFLVSTPLTNQGGFILKAGNSLVADDSLTLMTRM